RQRLERPGAPHRAPWLRREDDDLERHAPRRQHAQRPQLAAQPRGRRAPAALAEDKRPQRQERVEGDLDAEGPGLAEPGGERVGAVDLPEAVVDDDAARREDALLVK